mmetsp:Transcript_12502/g.24243  ORF Transcript_12502/g.24243 Transcript_12502/m.24243 type:complete len:655 (+) Transcript_12502:240-2204(+)
MAPSGKRSLTDDVFASLVGGLKFDKGANAMALDVLRRRPNKQPQPQQHGDTDVAGGRKRPRTSALDFFNSGPSSATAKKSGTENAKPREAVKASKPTKASKSAKESQGDDQEAQEVNDAEMDEAALTGGAEAEAAMHALDDEDIKALRKRLQIKVRGNDLRNPVLSFSVAELTRLKHQEGEKAVSEHALRERARVICENIERSKYAEPTPIQMETLPALLAGRDILGCAPTGSGKTASFLLPMIMRFQNRHGHSRGPQALVIAPTRELAAQILREFEKLAQNVKGVRGALLRKGTKTPEKFDMVVTTPERLASMVAEKEVDLSTVHYLVLDEADKLFEMGFLEHVDEIISACGANTQRVMVSATMPPQIEQLAQTVLRDPVQIVIGTKNAGATTIDQKLIFAGQENGKMIGLQQLIQDGELTPPTLVFVQSKDRAQQLYEELVYDGYKIDVMHSDRTQQQRDEVVRRFRAGQVWILICTELMGRGIDFKGVRCVVNYDFPTSAISYVHRIGRTGRANQTGKAYTFFTHDDIEYLRPIANVMRLSGCEVPDWMLKLRKPSTKERKTLQRRPVERKAISAFGRRKQGQLRVTKGKDSKGTKRKASDTSDQQGKDDQSSIEKAVPKAASASAKKSKKSSSSEKAKSPKTRKVRTSNK